MERLTSNKHNTYNNKASQLLYHPQPPQGMTWNDMFFFCIRYISLISFLPMNKTQALLSPSTFLFFLPYLFPWWLGWHGPPVVGSAVVPGGGGVILLWVHLVGTVGSRNKWSFITPILWRRLQKKHTYITSIQTANMCCTWHSPPYYQVLIWHRESYYLTHLDTCCFSTVPGEPGDASVFSCEFLRLLSCCSVSSSSSDAKGSTSCLCVISTGRSPPPTLPPPPPLLLLLSDAWWKNHNYNTISILQNAEKKQKLIWHLSSQC